MGWDELFDDLEVRFAAEHEGARRAAATETERARIATLTVRDRLRAAVGLAVSVETAASLTSGQITLIGADWCVVSSSAGDAVIPLDAVRSVSLRADIITQTLLPLPDDEMLARIRFGFVLRALARSRTPVTLARAGVDPLTGTIDRAGADHLDLAVHDADQPRREENVRRIVMIPYGGVAAVMPATGFRVPFS